MVTLNIDMPTNCMNCPLLGKGSMYCQVYPRKDLNPIEVVNSKPEWCPIIADSAENKRDLISRQVVLDLLQMKYSGKELYKAIYELPSAENKGESKHGHWIRMSDLPEDKDDRYKCSQCGNVVHHSNGVNLYTFNSWCGRCGSLNNSLLAGLESHKAESEE